MVIKRDVAQTIVRSCNEGFRALESGEKWRSVRKVVLQSGSLYVTRRVFADRSRNHPTIMRWTENGWLDIRGFEDRGSGHKTLEVWI